MRKQIFISCVTLQLNFIQFSCFAEKWIVVDLNKQKLSALESPTVTFRYRADGSLKDAVVPGQYKYAKWQFNCATGDYKHKTEAGTYRIYRKVRHHVSTTYGRPMPFSMFFSTDGKAIHGAPCCVDLISLLKQMGINYFGSAGCVRLSHDDVEVLWNWADIGTLVFITYSD